MTSVSPSSRTDVAVAARSRHPVRGAGRSRAESGSKNPRGILPSVTGIMARLAGVQESGCKGCPSLVGIDWLLLTDICEAAKQTEVVGKLEGDKFAVASVKMKE